MKTRKFYYLALCAIASITLSSCGGGGGSSSDPEFKLSDLQALWQENGTEHFARFTEELNDVISFVKNQFGEIEERKEWSPASEAEQPAEETETPAETEAEDEGEEKKKSGFFGRFMK